MLTELLNYRTARCQTYLDLSREVCISANAGVVGDSTRRLSDFFDDTIELKVKLARNSRYSQGVLYLQRKPGRQLPTRLSFVKLRGRWHFGLHPDRGRKPTPEQR